MRDVPFDPERHYRPENFDPPDEGAEEREEKREEKREEAVRRLNELRSALHGLCALGGRPAPSAVTAALSSVSAGPMSCVPSALDSAAYAGGRANQRNVTLGLI